MPMNRFQTIAAATLCLLGAPAHAAMTQWQDIGGGQARLLAVENADTQMVSGVLEIELKEGWKTYWRQPGSSGIPPQMDFSRSSNFVAGDVRIPAPQVLSAGDTHFAGYKERTAFFFEGQPMASDGVLRLDLFAGVCQEICIPAQASFEIPLTSLAVSDPRAETVIAMAREGLPGEARPGFSIADAKAHQDWSLEVSAELPDGGEPGLFVEGPEGWYFPQAVLVSAGAGKATFRIGPPQKPDGAGAPGQLRFTLTNGASAIEQWVEPGS